MINVCCMQASKGWAIKSYLTSLPWSSMNQQCARKAILDRSRYVRLELLERYHALKGVEYWHRFPTLDAVAAKETTRNEATINTSRDSEFKEHLMWFAGCHCNLSMYPVKDQCFMLFFCSCWICILYLLDLPKGDQSPKHHPSWSVQTVASPIGDEKVYRTLVVEAHVVYLEKPHGTECRNHKICSGGQLCQLQDVGSKWPWNPTSGDGSGQCLSNSDLRDLKPAVSERFKKKCCGFWKAPGEFLLQFPVASLDLTSTTGFSMYEDK